MTSTTIYVFTPDNDKATRDNINVNISLINIIIRFVNEEYNYPLNISILVKCFVAYGILNGHVYLFNTFFFSFFFLSFLVFFFWGGGRCGGDMP